MFLVIILLHLCSNVKHSSCQTTDKQTPPASKIFAKSSGNVRLDCVVEKRAFSKWLINDSRVTFGTDFIANIPQSKMRLLSNYSLIIAQVSNSDEGLYRCFHREELVSHYQLAMEVPPANTVLIFDGKINPTELWMRMNGSANITCCARGAMPAVGIQWVVNDDVIKSPTTVISSSGKDAAMFDSVSFLRFTMNMQKVYIVCNFTQGSNYIHTRRVLIRKAERPSLYIMDAKGNIVTQLLAVQGSEYNLTCKAVGGKPHNITWFVMDVPYSTVATYNTRGDSRIATAFSTYNYKPDAQLLHQGDLFHISCLTFDEMILGEIRYTINVTNIALPTLSVTYNGKELPSVYRLEEDEEHVLVCKATGAKPEVMVKWILNKQQFPGYNATSVASRSQLGTYDTISFLTYKPRNDFDTVTCFCEGKYEAQTVYLSLRIRGIGARGSLSGKKILSLSIILTSLCVVGCIVIMRIYLKSVTLNVENSHEYEWHSDSEASKLSPCATIMKGTGKPPSFSPPEVPQEELYSAFHGQNSLIESEDVYYSSIKHDSPELRVFSTEEVTMITCLKKGSHIDRWMGVIPCSKTTEKSVLVSTKTDNPLYADCIHWPGYIKKIMDLKDNPFVVKVEGICVVSANLYLIQEYLPSVSLDKILSNQLFNKSCLCIDQFSYAVEIMEGIEFIHSFGFLHPALSTRKVLLSPDRHCKLYDFVLEEDAPSKLGLLKTRETCSLNDLPLESLLRNEYTQESDVWLIAVLCWSLLLNGNQPFVQKKFTFADIYHHLPKKPIIFSSSLYGIFEDAWKEDYLSRPTVREIRNMMRSETVCFQKESCKNQDNITNDQDHYMPMTAV